MFLDPIKPYLRLIEVVGAAAIVAGAFFYGRHTQSQSDQLAAQELRLAEQRKVDEAVAAATRDSRALQASAEVRAARLQDQLKEVPHAPTPILHCPVPSAVLTGLQESPTRPGGVAAPGGPASPSGGAGGGTLDASALVDNLRVNRGAFERNRIRLENCIAQYDEVRAKINAVQ